MSRVVADAGYAPRRIIVADDVRALRQLLRGALENDPRFEVVGEAGDGAEAVELAARELPDLVLLDLSMPIMDGLQALPEIRRRAPRTRVVVYSGIVTPQAEASAFSAGAHGFVRKGTSLKGLLDRLAALGIDEILEAEAQT